MKKWTALIFSILAVFVLAAAAYADQEPDPETPFIELVPAFELKEDPETPDILLWESRFFEIHTNIVRNDNVLFFFDDGTEPIWVWVDDNGYGEAWFTPGTTDVNIFEYEEAYNAQNMVHTYHAHVETMAEDENDIVESNPVEYTTGLISADVPEFAPVITGVTTGALRRDDVFTATVSNEPGFENMCVVLFDGNGEFAVDSHWVGVNDDPEAGPATIETPLLRLEVNREYTAKIYGLKNGYPMAYAADEYPILILSPSFQEEGTDILIRGLHDEYLTGEMIMPTIYYPNSEQLDNIRMDIAIYAREFENDRHQWDSNLYVWPDEGEDIYFQPEIWEGPPSSWTTGEHVCRVTIWQDVDEDESIQVDSIERTFTVTSNGPLDYDPELPAFINASGLPYRIEIPRPDAEIFRVYGEKWDLLDESDEPEPMVYWFDEWGEGPAVIPVDRASERLYVNIEIGKTGYDWYRYETSIPVISDNPGIRLWTDENLTGENADPLPINENVRLWVSAPGADWIRVDNIYGPFFDENDPGRINSDAPIEFNDDIKREGPNPIIANAQFTDGEGNRTIESAMLILQGYALGEAGPFTASIDNDHVERGETVNVTYTKSENAEHYWVDVDCWNEDWQGWDYFIHLADLNVWGENNGGTAILDTMELAPGSYRLRAVAEGTGYYRAEYVITEGFNVSEADIPESGILVNVTSDHVETSEDFQVSAYAPGAEWLEVYWDYGNDSHWGNSDGGESRSWSHSYGRSGTYQIKVKAGRPALDGEGNEIWESDDDGNEWQKQDEWWSDPVTVTVSAENGALTLTPPELPASLAPSENAEISFTVEKPENAETIAASVWLKGEDNDLFWENTWEEELAVNVQTSLEAGQTVCVSIYAQARGYECADFELRIPVIDGTSSDLVLLTIGEGDIDNEGDVPIHAHVKFLVGAAEGHTLTAAKLYGPGGWWGGENGEIIDHENHDDWFDREGRAFFWANFDHEEDIGRNVPVYALARIDDSEDWVQSETLWFMQRDYEIGSYSFTGETTMTVERGKDAVFTFTAADGAEDYWVDAWDIYQDWDSYQPDSVCNGTTVTMNTAQLPEGEYIIRGRAGADGKGWRESDNSVRLFVTASAVPDGEVQLTVDKTEALTEEEICASFFAPGADWVEVIRRNEDGWEEDFRRNDGEGVTGRFSESNSRIVEVFGRAHFFERDGNGDTIKLYDNEGNPYLKELPYKDSGIVEVTFRAPRGLIEVDGTDIPASAIAGTDLHLHVPYPAHAEYMGWDLFLDRNFDDDWQEPDHSGDNDPGDAFDITIPGSEIIAGNTMELRVWAGATGYEHDHQNYTIRVIEAPEERITLTVSKSEVQVNEDFTVTISVDEELGADYVQYNNGGDRFWSYWDDEAGQETDFLRLDENSQWKFEHENFGDAGARTLFARAWIPDESAEDGGYWIESDPVKVTITRTGIVGDFSAVLEEATVARGETVVLNYTVAKDSNEKRYDLHHDRNREFDGDDWIDYDLHWQRNEDENKFIFSTAGMPAGEYWLSVWACGEPGYEGRESRRVFLTVTEGNVLNGEISLTADRTEALTGEDVFVSLLAPGSDWVEIIRIQDDGREEMFIDNDGEGTADSLNENDPRTVRLFGRAHFFERDENGNTIELYDDEGRPYTKELPHKDSAPVEITFRAPYGRIWQDAANIPVSATAGQPLVLSMQYPEDASYMGWRLYLNRDYEEEDQRADYSGEGKLELTVPGDRIVQGNQIELQVWVDGIGYEHNHQNYNILVTNGHEERITLEVSKNEVLTYENFTVTVSAPGVDSFQYFNGNVFWTDRDEDDNEVIRNIAPDENGQWIFEEQNYDETGVKALYARTWMDGEWVTSDPVKVTVTKLGTVGDFSVNLQEATVTRGEMVTLDYTVADHSNENGYDLHHDRNRRDDGEYWIDYRLNWQRDEEAHQITFSTAEMPAGEYWLSVWAPGEVGYEGRMTDRIWLTVNEPEENTIGFEVSGSRVQTCEDVRVSVYAPGAYRGEIHWHDNDKWDFDGDSWSGSYNYGDAGAYQVFARVWYPDQQDPVDSDLITVTVTSNGQKILMDLSNIPARIIAGEDTWISVIRPDDSQYMDWEIYINDNPDHDGPDPYAHNHDGEYESLNQRIPGTDLREGDTVHLKIWTGATGYDNNHQEIRIPVVGQANEGITFTVNPLPAETCENIRCTAEFPAGEYSKIEFFDGERYRDEESLEEDETSRTFECSFGIDGTYTVYARLQRKTDGEWEYTPDEDVEVIAPNGPLTLDVSGVPTRIYEGNDVTFALGEVKDAAGNPVDFRPNYELFYDDDTERKDLITWDEDPENPKTGIITISQNDIVDGRVFRLNYNVFARGYEPVLGGMDIQAYAEPTVMLSVDKKTIRYGETVTFTVNAPGATSAWVEDQDGQPLDGLTWTANKIGTFQFSAAAAFDGFGTVTAVRPVSVTVRTLGEAPAPSVDMPESGDEGAQFDVHITPVPGGWYAVQIYYGNGEEPVQNVEYSEMEQTLSVNDAYAGQYRVQIEYGKEGYDNGQTERSIHIDYWFTCRDPEWTWEEDLSAAHLVFSSMRQEATETVEAEISSEVTAEPTCDTEGTRTYTATGIYNGQTYTDTRTEPIAMTGHAWNAPVFTWTEDGEGYSATATFTCGKCGDSRTENAEVTRIRHTDATCTKQEVSVYRAVCEGYSEDKTVYGDALGHDWGDWSIVWNDDYTAFATRRCGRCGQTENAEVTVTHEVTVTATCQRKGEITYTASAAPGGQEVTSTKRQYTPKTGHTPGRPETSEDGHFTYTYCDVCGELLSSDFAGHLWSDPVYVWAEDYSTVTATHTCTLTPHLPHSESETVEAELARITTEPTCEETGLAEYVSKPFANAAFTVQTHTDVQVAALGHEWGEPEYEWLYGNTKVRATRKCTHNEEHTDTEEVGVTVVSYKAPTETKAGKAVYTSEAFTMDGCTVQTKTVDIPALNKITSTMNLPSGLTVIETEAFSNLGCGAIIVPAGCTRIEERAFAGCRNLIYIRIPASLKGTVPDSAFEGCNADLVIDWK